MIMETDRKIEDEAGKIHHCSSKCDRQEICLTQSCSARQSRALGHNKINKIKMSGNHNSQAFYRSLIGAGTGFSRPVSFFPTKFWDHRTGVSIIIFRFFFFFLDSQNKS